MTAHSLPDQHQTVWQLSAIQLSGWMSLPILATSVLVLEQNSFYGAVLTIIVGNVMLWFIRFAIIAMSYKKRQSTLDISRDYLGHLGSYFIGALCIISTLAWFITQTTAASNTLTHLILMHENPSIDRFTQMSVFLGVISTFLCMNGIVILRKLTTLVFPFLLIAFVVIMFTIPLSIPQDSTAVLSLSGLTLVLGTNLGITSDLPTFFRHSKSFQTSVMALTVIQLVSLVLAICSLYFGAILTNAFNVNDGVVLGMGNEVLRYGLILFVTLSVVCANVANVYSASVGWEVIAPTALVGKKEYLILGLGLTTIFILVSNMFSIDCLLHSSDSSLINLCIVLVLGYIISRIRKRSPTVIEQGTYFMGWFISSIANTLQFMNFFHSPLSPIVVGPIVILFVFFLSFVCSAIAKRIKSLYI